MLYYLPLGIADGHELGRVFTNADKNCFEDFSISFLSPVMTFTERPIKSLNIRDEVGYIEIQIRKMLQVPAHKSTRLWVEMLHQNISIFEKLQCHFYLWQQNLFFRDTLIVVMRTTNNLLQYFKLFWSNIFITKTAIMIN